MDADSNKPIPTPPAPSTTQSEQAEPEELVPAPRTVVEHLLQSPLGLGRALLEERGQNTLRQLSITAATGLLIYGLLMGSFAGGSQYWAAPVKLLLGVGGSLLICLPSLFILGCLGGIRLDIAQLAALSIQSLALMAVLLVGFAPIAWIFAQSTSAPAFMAALHLLIGLSSLAFALRLLRRLLDRLGGIREGGRFRLFRPWAAIFTVVLLQMFTTLRPLIGPDDGRFLPREKRFFAQHWVDTLGGAP